MAQSRTRTTSLALASLLTLPIPAAIAQTTLPEIVIYANQAPTEAGRVGSTVTVLRGTELLAKGYSTVADALRTVPGVAVSALAGRGGFAHARIRGAEANHALILINDVPVNSLTDGDFNFADFALEDIERIEIIRGPQSGIYGANAHAGVISIVTKTGRGLTRPEANFRVEGGMNRTGAVGATARGASGLAYGALSVDYNTTDGHNMAMNGSERDGSRGLTVTAKGGVDVSPNFNIEGSVRAWRRQADIDPQPFAGPFEGLALDSSPDYNRFNGLTARVAAMLSLFDGAWVQRLSAGRYGERRSDDDTIFGYFRSQGHRDQFEYKSTMTGETQFVGGERHTLTFAADRQFDFLTIDSESFVFDPSAAAFWANGVDRTRTGIAGEYSLELPRGTTLTGAVRHDWNTGFENALTWRATLSQRLPMAARLHASVGIGITNPTFIEQFGFFPGSFIGNPNLMPERSLGWDAGIEQTFLDGRLITDVTYFASDFEDKIVLMGFPTTPVNVPGISPRRGVEVTARFIPVEWLTLAATYTYTDARLADGTPEIRRPRHSASASATALFAEGRGRATVNVVYNGTTPDTWFRFPTVPVTLAAYTVVGTIISYDITPATTVFVRAENVFDQEYENIFSYRAPGFAAYAGMKVKLGVN